MASNMMDESSPSLPTGASSASKRRGISQLQPLEDDPTTDSNSHELNRWIRQPAISAHLNSSISRVKALLNKRKMAQSAVDKLTTAAATGITPPSLKVRNHSITFNSEHSAQAQELRTNYEKGLVKLTLDARTSKLAAIDDELTQFRADQTKFLEDVIEAEATVLSALKSVVNSTRLNKSLYINFFFSQLDSKLQDLALTLAAAEVIKQRKQEKATALKIAAQEKVHAQPLEKSVADLIKAEVTKQLKLRPALKHTNPQGVRFQQPKSLPSRSPSRSSQHTPRSRSHSPSRSPRKPSHSRSHSPSKPPRHSRNSRSRTPPSRNRSQSKNEQRRGQGQGPGKYTIQMIHGPNDRTSWRSDASSPRPHRR